MRGACARPWARPIGVIPGSSISARAGAAIRGKDGSPRWRWMSPTLLAAACYVELNPVRARLAERAGDWRWSSARAHLDGRDDALVRVAPLLALAPDWAAFLAGGLGAEEHAAI